MKVRLTAPIVFSVALVAATGVSAQTKTPTPAGKAAGHVTYNVAPTGNEARYYIREELASIGFKEVVGKTSDVKGKVVIDANGAILKDSSRIVVNAQSLQTDTKRRDASLRKQTLETDTYPQISLVPVSFTGFSGELGAGEEKSFSMVGDLTIRNVTHPSTWQVTAKRQGNDITGTAKIAFALTDFSIAKPKALMVLTVADSVRLEYDFHFTPATSAEVVK